MQLFSRTLLLSSLCAMFGLFAAKETTGDKKMETKTAAAPKIAVVNLHKIITVDPKGLGTASVEWKALYDKLQETLVPANKEISDLEEKYRKKMADLESLQKSGVSSKETLQKKYEEELAPLQYQLQGQYQQRERFAQEELAKAQSVIAPKIEKVLEEIQAAQGWDLIIKGDAVVGKPAKKFDVTEDVLQALNKQYSGEKSKKADTVVKK